MTKSIKEIEKDGLNQITGQVVDATYKVHTALGPGLLESVYEVCLRHEIMKRGLAVDSQVPLPVKYDNITIDMSYRLDLLVENCVVIELKTVEEISKVHKAQILSYLKLGKYPVGFLLNFNVVSMKDGIQRFVN